MQAPGLSVLGEVAQHLPQEVVYEIQQLYTNKQIEQNFDGSSAPTVDLWTIRTTLCPWFDSSLRNILRSLTNPLHEAEIERWCNEFRALLSQHLPLDSNSRYLQSQPNCKLYHLMETCLQQECRLVTRSLLQQVERAVHSFGSNATELTALRTLQFPILNFEDVQRGGNWFNFPETVHDAQSISEKARVTKQCWDHAVTLTTNFLRLSGLPDRVKRLRYHSYFYNRSFHVYSDYVKENLTPLLAFHNLLLSLGQGVTDGISSEISQQQQQDLNRTVMETKELINLLIAKSCIVSTIGLEGQIGPKAVKKGSKVGADVYMIKIGAMMNQQVESSHPKFKFFLLNEDQCRKVHLYLTGQMEFDKELVAAALECQIISSKTKKITSRSLAKSAWHVNYDSCIRIANRPTFLEESQPGFILRQKCYLLCVANVNVDNVTSYQVLSYSQPFVITTNTSQNVEVAGTLFWDTVFAHPGDPFAVPDQVTLSQFVQGLETLTKAEAGAKIPFSVTTKSYLMQKLMDAVPTCGNVGLTRADFETCMRKRHKTVKKTKRNQGTGSRDLDQEEDPSSDKHFFWNWFCDVVGLIKLDILDYYNKGAIMLISRNDAEAFVRQSGNGSFLLRFSDSYRGQLSLVFCENGDAVSGLCPKVDASILSRCIGEYASLTTALCYDASGHRVVSVSKRDVFQSTAADFFAISSNRRDYRKAVLTWPAVNSQNVAAQAVV